jgi:hypothetical protein
LICKVKDGIRMRFAASSLCVILNASSSLQHRGMVLGWALRATDCANIFCAARKLLIWLARKMLRATDEPCYFSANRAIMRRAMLRNPSISGIRAGSSAAVQFFGAAAHVSTSESAFALDMCDRWCCSQAELNPGEIPPQIYGISHLDPSASSGISHVIPGDFVGYPMGSVGSRGVSALYSRIRSKTFFKTERFGETWLKTSTSYSSDKNGNPQPFFRHAVMVMQWSVASRVRTSKPRSWRGTTFTANSLLFRGLTRFPQCS